MKIEGAILSIKHPEHYYGANVHRVRFKFKWKGKVTERETYVVGVSACGDDLSFQSAALAVARSYAGSRVKILGVDFIGTAVVTGHIHDLIAAQFRTPDET
jgi:hypothetical protein